MKELIDLTAQFAQKIIELESQRQKVGRLVRQLRLTPSDEVLERRAVIRVRKTVPARLKIVGVDGGLVKRRLHGANLMLTRTVAVIFTYTQGRLVAVSYHPTSNPSPTPHIYFDPSSDFDFDTLASLARRNAEVGCATHAAQQFGPHLLLLHGPLLPHHMPRTGSSLTSAAWQELVSSYIRLFDEAHKMLLAGIVEDGQATRFCELIATALGPSADQNVRTLLGMTADSNLLTYTLDRGERSAIFTRCSEPTDHPILRQFGEVANSLYVFYLRTGEFDRPIRVEFFAPGQVVRTARRIASALLSLTGHAGYGMPSVLIEADCRARLTKSDLDLFYQELINRVGCLPGLASLRREARPL
jgi:hypothetical protein